MREPRIDWHCDMGWPRPMPRYYLHGVHPDDEFLWYAYPIWQDSCYMAVVRRDALYRCLDCAIDQMVRGVPMSAQEMLHHVRDHVVWGRRSFTIPAPHYAKLIEMLKEAL